MGEGDGDLILYRIKEPLEFWGKLEVKDKCVEPATTIKYKPNMLVYFFNTVSSVHGVTPRRPSEKCRRLVALSCELGRNLFTTGHGKF